MAKTKIIAGVLIVLVLSIGFGVFRTFRTDRQGPAPTAKLTQRTDKAPLTKRFPFLGNFEKCSWVGGIKDDRSKGLVAAPSSYFIRGYVVLEPSQTKDLLDRYPWVESKTETIPAPTDPLGEGFPPVEGPFLKSDAFIRALPSMTTFASGTILLQPRDNLLYLDLWAD